MYILIALGLILFLFLIYTIVDNLRIKIRKVDIKLVDTKAKEKSKKFKILHISDFHNQNWGKDNKYLLDKINTIHPDYIFITGDLIDRKTTDVKVVYKFIDDLNEILNKKKEQKNYKSRIFYVYGNHEKSKSDEIIKDYEKTLKLKNVSILKDDVKQIFLNNRQINIIGLDDPFKELFYAINNTDKLKVSILDYFNKENDSNKENLKIIDEKMNRLLAKNKEELDKGFNILLTHRPEAFPVYRKQNIDLVLAGHAHGGLFRLPFTNISLIAPNQSVFPKYTKGPYIENNTVMYVSLGLGHSVIPFRIFAGPELIEIEIEI